MSEHPSAATAVVLAGGTSRRFGADKLAADLGGVPLLDRTLDGLPGGWAVVCVGARRATAREVAWVREEPPGTGPLAGVAAALVVVTTDVTVVVAGDLPAAGGLLPDLVTALDADPDVDAVSVVDGEGHANPLLTAYRTDVLRRIMPADPSDTPARLMLRTLRHKGIVVDDGREDDVDTRADLAVLRSRLSSRPPE